jgi:acylphosphatase
MLAACFKAWVHGRVQGVGFRYSTQAEARTLGVLGYARNLDDGSVEVLAWGEAEQVDALIAWLKAGGPRSAPHQPAEPPRDFTTG